MRTSPTVAHRRWKLGLAFACFLLLVLAALSVSTGSRSGEAQPGDSVRLVFVGDVNLDGRPGKIIAANGDPFAAVAPWLADADATLANLECVVATTGVPYEKNWTFRAHPRVLTCLGRHFTAVSLANNHTGDFGRDAFREQLGLLQGRRIAYFGGGANLREAHTPLILERNGLRIALLGYNDFHPREFEAGPDSPGVAWAVEEQMAADVRAARTTHRADLVLPYLHWGWDEYPTDDRQKQLARVLIDSGADAVIGSHPHITQDVEYYGGKLIVYSLGNFVFEGFKTEETRVGWLLRLTLRRDGGTNWDTVPVRLDEQGVPQVARDVASPWGTSDGPTMGRRFYRERNPRASP